MTKRQESVAGGENLFDQLLRTRTHQTPPSSEKLGPLRTYAVLPPFGTQVRFKLSTKANLITVPRPY